MLDAEAATWTAVLAAAPLAPLFPPPPAPNRESAVTEGVAAAAAARDPPQGEGKNPESSSSRVKRLKAGGGDGIG